MLFLLSLTLSLQDFKGSTLEDPTQAAATTENQAVHKKNESNLKHTVSISDSSST